MPQPCNAKSRTPKAHSEGFALSRLPIEVPYHSVIGQRRPGPRERGSDGVVPYWSSHLDGAQSEVIVRSGHGVFSNPEAVQEVIRILHLASPGKAHKFRRLREGWQNRFSETTATEGTRWGRGKIRRPLQPRLRVDSRF